MSKNSNSRKTNITTLILANPRARNGRLERDWDEFKNPILDALGKIENEVHVTFTRPTNPGGETIKVALKSGIKQILVIGGDGTISEAIQGFFEDDKVISTDAVLMVLPGGRGDDLFKTISNEFFFSRQSGWNRGLEIIKTGTPMRSDLGKIQWIGTHPAKDRYFINIASFGFPGLIVERVLTQKKYLGSSLINKTGLAYVLQGAVAMTQYKPLEFEVKVDGKEGYKGKITYGFIMNGRRNAGGICWDPSTRIDDGLLNIFVMAPCNPFEQSRRLSRLILGSREKIPGVWLATGKQFEVLLSNQEQKTHSIFEIDGEIPENKTIVGARLEILPGIIQIQMPPPAKASQSAG